MRHTHAVFMLMSVLCYSGHFSACVNLEEVYVTQAMFTHLVPELHKSTCVTQAYLCDLHQNHKLAFLRRGSHNINRGMVCRKCDFST